MSWQEFYEKYNEKSGKELEVGIKDWEQRSRIFLKWLESQRVDKNSTILDCGCGIGIGGMILKDNGYENVVGIDIETDRVKTASRFFKAYVMDCNDIKINDNFGVVIALNIIEHLELPEKFLCRIKQILNPEGLVILSLPNEIWFRKFFGRIPKDPTHRQSWSIFSFKRFLNKNGFHVTGMKPVGRIPFVLGCQTFMVLARVKR